MTTAGGAAESERIPNHDLPFARVLPLEERRQHTKRQVERSAAEVAHDVERRQGPRIFWPDRHQGAGERDEVDVVP